MTDKQGIFCNEYLIDLNASKAARRAGYSEDSSRTIGYELMNNPEVRERIEFLMAERAQRCEVTADDLLKEFKGVGMANIQDYLNDDFSIKTLSEMTREKAKAIKSIKKTVVESPISTTTTVEFVLHDKLSGLVNIGKHIGFYAVDNAQSKQENKVLIDKGVIQEISKKLDGDY